MKKIFSIILNPLKFLSKKLSDLVYNIKSNIYQKTHKNKSPKKGCKKRDKLFDYLFYGAFMAVPLIMFVITYFVISGQALFLGFEKYEGDKVVFAGFENFKTLFVNFKSSQYYGQMFRRSLLVWVVSTITASIIPITFSFYVYKKYLGHSVFKILLFLPSLFSSIITVTIFKMIANEVVPEIFKLLFNKKIEPLIGNPGTTFSTLLFYYVWNGLGSGLLMQLAVMNSIDPSISESAQLEGIGFFGELWYIVLPACYRVLSINIIVGIAGIFGNTINLYAFYGTNAPSNTTTLGYYFQVETLNAAYYDYPYLSAWGLLVTVIVTPITLLARKLINRFGPSED